MFHNFIIKKLEKINDYIEKNKNIPLFDQNQIKLKNELENILNFSKTLKFVNDKDSKSFYFASFSNDFYFDYFVSKIYYNNTISHHDYIKYYSYLDSNSEFNFFFLNDNFKIFAKKLIYEKNYEYEFKFYQDSLNGNFITINTSYEVDKIDDSEELFNNNIEDELYSNFVANIHTHPNVKIDLNFFNNLSIPSPNDIIALTSMMNEIIIANEGIYVLKNHINFTPCIKSNDSSYIYLEEKISVNDLKDKTLNINFFECYQDRILKKYMDILDNIKKEFNYLDNSNDYVFLAENMCNILNNEFNGLLSFKFYNWNNDWTQIKIEKGSIFYLEKPKNKKNYLKLEEFEINFENILLMKPNSIF